MRISTPEGDKTLPEGQVITLPKEKALALIEKGKITPFEKVAYKVYSEILEAFLWVVADDMKALKASENVTEAIYTHDEIKKLRGMDDEGLKAVHRVKEIFEDSTIEAVNLNRREG